MPSSAPVRVACLLVGCLLLGLAAVATAYGVYQFSTGEPLLFAELGHLWYRRHPTSLQLLQPALERHVAEWLWDPVMLAILTTPTWIVIGAVTLAAGLLGTLLVRAGRSSTRSPARG